jgi:hypothetical protein
MVSMVIGFGVATLPATAVLFVLQIIEELRRA